MSTKKNGLTVGQASYTFREPTGRDIVSFDEITTEKKTGQVESMAVLAALLETSQTYDADYFLDLPFSQFKEISEYLNNYFRV